MPISELRLLELYKLSAAVEKQESNRQREKMQTLQRIPGSNPELFLPVTMLLATLLYMKYLNENLLVFFPSDAHACRNDPD